MVAIKGEDGVGRGWEDELLGWPVGPSALMRQNKNKKQEHQ